LLADAQSMDLQETTEVTPDVDQTMQEKLQKETKESTARVDFFLKEISKSQKFLAVSTNNRVFIFYYVTSSCDKSPVAGIVQTSCCPSSETSTG